MYLCIYAWHSFGLMHVYLSIYLCIHICASQNLRPKIKALTASFYNSDYVCVSEFICTYAYILHMKSQHNMITNLDILIINDAAILVE